jgi:cytochrome P450
MHRLQHHPAFIPAAVEELLRYSAPVSLSDERWASQDIPLHGKVIRKGEMVLAAVIATNADPHQFLDGEALDMTRQPQAASGLWQRHPFLPGSAVGSPGRSDS